MYNNIHYKSTQAYHGICGHCVVNILNFKRQQNKNFTREGIIPLYSIMSFQNVNTELAVHFNNIYCTISIRIFMALVFIFLCHRFFKFCQSLRSSHIKLNCWYCNCDSYILRRGGQTLKHWQCTFCGSENARSQVL